MLVVDMISLSVMFEAWLSLEFCLRRSFILTMSMVFVLNLESLDDIEVAHLAFVFGLPNGERRCHPYNGRLEQPPWGMCC